MMNSIIDKIICEQKAIENEHFKKAFRNMFNADLEILIKAIPQDFRCESSLDGMNKKYFWCDKVFLTTHSEFNFGEKKSLFTTTYEYLQTK